MPKTHDNRGRFAKGNKCAKGHGRPKTPKDLVEGKRLTKTEFRRSVDRFLFMGIDKLKEINLDEWNVLDGIVIQIVKKALVEGDYRRLDFILDRLIGKVVEKVEVTPPKPFIYERLDGSTVEAGVTIDVDADDVKELPDGESNS